jgi:hypothetical protein
MEVVADLGERVLGRFTREIAKFVPKRVARGSASATGPAGPVSVRSRTPLR